MSESHGSVIIHVNMAEYEVDSHDGYSPASRLRRLGTSPSRIRSASVALHAVFLLFKPHLLESDHIPGLNVPRLVDDAKGALAELLQLLVVIVRALGATRRHGRVRAPALASLVERGSEKKLHVVKTPQRVTALLKKKTL